MAMSKANDPLVTADHDFDHLDGAFFTRLLITL